MLEKPDFSAKEGGIVDPDFFNTSLRGELLLILNSSRLTDSQKSSLIVFASKMAQSVFDGPRSPHQHVVAELEALQANARRVLASLRKLSPDAIEAIEAHANALPLGAHADLPIEDHVRRAAGDFIGTAWDWVSAVAQLAELVQQPYQLDRQTKPEQSRARGYVTLLAQRVRGLTGSLPPKDRAAWFAQFASAIGERMGQEIGPRLVATGIEEAAR